VHCQCVARVQALDRIFETFSWKNFDLGRNYLKRAEHGNAKQSYQELEAQQLVDEAKKKSDALRSSGEDALKLAARDALLKLRDTLLGNFSNEVKRVVGQKMDQPAFLEKIILQLAGKARDQLVEELKNNPDELKAGTLTHYTAAIAADMLRKGVSIQVADDIKCGISVRLKEDGMKVDFTDETLSALLLEHLQPRFRTLLQGIVK